ncbi:hypothetical protein L596_017047 [Steinernema carpocapsae]|uniref:Uncharacterized protein n=1 Tax=Steinernema carpocapsae TaxID=34508 RepID=A0A4V6A1J8_STECR|nr:hypothetical protein L596_017047 [Steinernema carpocapsae]
MRLTGIYSLVSDLEAYVRKNPRSYDCSKLCCNTALFLRKLSKFENGLKKTETQEALRLSEKIRNLAKVFNDPEKDYYCITKRRPTIFQPLVAEAFIEAIGILKKADDYRIVWKKVPDSFVHLPPEIISDVLTPDVDGYCPGYRYAYEYFLFLNGPWSEVASLKASKMAEKFENETKYKENSLWNRFKSMTKLAVPFNLSVNIDQELIEIASKLRGSITVHHYDLSSWSHLDQVFYSNLEVRNFTFVTMNIIECRANCKALLQRLLKSPNLRGFNLILSMELELEDELLNFVSLENFFFLNYRSFAPLYQATECIKRSSSSSKLANKIFKFFKQKNFGLDVKIRYVQLCLSVENAKAIKESLKMESVSKSNQHYKCSSWIEVKNDHDEDVSVVAFLKDNNKYDRGTVVFGIYAGERSEHMIERFASHSNSRSVVSYVSNEDTDFNGEPTGDGVWE